MEEAPKKYSVSTIIITVLTVILILVLSFLFFYYSTKPVPVAPTQTVTVAPKIIPTNVISFAPPAVLPSKTESGYCWVGSIAAAFRNDAWRCMVGNGIYDPCFETKQSETGDRADYVFCQVNPLDNSTAFLIKLTKPLPKPETVQSALDSWAWFIKLKDGTICSPFTGTRPYFGNPPGSQIAYYGCASKDASQQIVLLGDLVKGKVWTDIEGIAVKNGERWEIQSTKQVEVDTVWQ